QRRGFRSSQLLLPAKGAVGVSFDNPEKGCGGHGRAKTGGNPVPIAVALQDLFHFGAGKRLAERTQLERVYQERDRILAGDRVVPIAVRDGPALLNGRL